MATDPNAGLSAGLASHLYHGPNGLETDPLRNFKFIVKFHKDVKNPISGKKTTLGSTLAFTSIEGLNMSTQSIPYRTGGMNTTVQQIPGQTEFSPVTFINGVLLGRREKWDWMQELFALNVGQGSGRSAGEARSFRSLIDIYVLEHPVTTGVKHDAPVVFTLHNAWPTALSYSPLNSGDNGLLVEQMTMVHEGFTTKWRDKL